MTIPWPGQPESSVGGGSAQAQMTQGLQVVVRQLQSLEQVISAQTTALTRTRSASRRYQQESQVPAQPNMDPGVVAALQEGGATITGSGATQLSAMGATSSLANLRAYGAQQLGQWVYNSYSSSISPPLYNTGGGGGGGGSGGPGGGGGGGGGGNPPLSFGQQVGARVAASGGTIGGLLSQVPGFGLVSDLFNAYANNPYLQQREAARPFQEVEGGGNLAAQTERLHSLAYQASVLGLMPQGAAAQAFGAVTAMGFNQDAIGEGQQPQNRQSALNFIYHNYNAMGMDVTDSLQLIQSASQDAGVDLTKLSTTLQKLSQNAGEAGTSAETARQQFNAYFSQAIGMGAGPGATTLAGGIANMQGQMGKEFSGVNFSGELSQARQYLLAGMTGQTPAQLQYAARNAPGSYAQMLANQNMSFLTMGGLMTPQLTQSMQQLIAKAGGTAAVARNPGLRDQVATQFLNQNQVSANINESLWAQEISALTGVQMTPTQAFQWIVSQSAGVNEASLAASGTGGADQALGGWTASGASGHGVPAAARARTAARPAPAKPVVPPARPGISVPARPAATGSGHGVPAIVQQHAAAAAAPRPVNPAAQVVTIALTAEAKALLKVLPSRNDQAAASSQVPANPYVSQSSR